ncbi:uncharacterized protein LOC117100626 isoform X2 [Anneissia japonica]|uniref:uncharacterized protein LOC117100626 isoform X2 n=1 Tax=Anneissia japonica TaxID=1529436 RepID=UPI0014257ADC|nr:uncharacterized protein LOC117100626 isoform X2 [Anneissia japonica]
MTAIISQWKGRSKRNIDPGTNQIHAGYLELYNLECKQKWVVFEEIKSEVHPCRYQLTICPKNNGMKSKRKCYILDKDHFIGIEEGTVGKEAYFVIFLTSDNLIFQTKNKSEADSWCKIVKEHLTHERWSVQLKNDDNKLERYYLHVTNSFVSLTHNPPEVYKRWNIANIGRVSCESSGYLSIAVVESGSDSGFFQIKTQKSTDMIQIKEAIGKAKKEMAHREVEEKLTTEENTTHSPHQRSSVTQIMTKKHEEPRSHFTEPVRPGPRVPDLVRGKERDLRAKKPSPPTSPDRNPGPDLIYGGSGYITNCHFEGSESKSTACVEELTREYGNLENDSKRYQNGSLIVERPPPLPIRDDLRHFESVTLGDTIEAIRRKQVCFRDSLNIKPSKRHQLFAIMDASGWWKHLAAAIGLDVSDIEVVDNLAPRYNISWTEMVVYHWECTRNPSRICSIREMQNIAQETNRPDLLSMLADE